MNFLSQGKNYDISMILSFLFEFFIRNNPQSPCRCDLAELYMRNYNTFLEKSIISI